MGFVGNLLGLSGDSGMKFKARGTTIESPVTAAQAQAAGTQSEEALRQQQDFLNALAAQGGIQNQADVYKQYQALATGQGPSVAQQQLANATAQNVANQAALMASQRGAGVNPGLIARQAAQQGSTAQQQAAGQAAQLRAQEQLSALGNLQQIAGQQVGQQQRAREFQTGAQQAQQQALLNQINAQNQARIAMQSNINQANAGIQGEVARQQGNLFGNITGGLGGVLGLANGGEVPNTKSEPSSNVGKFLKMAMGGKVPMSKDGLVPGKAKTEGDNLKNDTVDAKLSPGEIVIPRSIAQSKDAPRKSAEFVAAILARKGK